MRQIRTDLWETTTDSPAPGLTTHAYVWTPPGGANVLFYNTAGDRELDEIERLGGVAHQYLSHRDEIGPALNTIGDRFGATLHCSAREAAIVAEVRAPDLTFDTRHVDRNGIEVIPTPGHTAGSVCYLVPGHDDLTYLFTGDTILLGADGAWFAGYLPNHSDAEDLASSLDLLASLEPDLVASSAFAGEHGVHVLDRPWADAVAEAKGALVSRARS